jgi:hypothetical protein
MHQPLLNLLTPTSPEAKNVEDPEDNVDYS